MSAPGFGMASSNAADRIGGASSPGTAGARRVVVERLVMGPRGRRNKLITTRGWLAVTASRHLPNPAPKAPTSPSPPNSSAGAETVRAPSAGTPKTTASPATPSSPTPATTAVAGAAPRLTTRNRLCRKVLPPGLKVATRCAAPAAGATSCMLETKPSRAADVRQHLQPGGAVFGVARCRCRTNLQPPIADASAHAARQPLRRIATLQVRRVEVRRAASADAQDDGRARGAGVVERHDARLGGRPAIDHAQEALVGARCGGKERNMVNGVGRRRRLRREVGDVAGGVCQQTQRPQRPVRRDGQAPLAGAVSQRAIERLRARLQLPRGERARGARRHGGVHGPGVVAVVVDGADGHVHGRIAGVDQAQPALLARIAARVEERDAMQPVALRGDVVHAG